MTREESSPSPGASRPPRGSLAITLVFCVGAFAAADYLALALRHDDGEGWGPSLLVSLVGVHAGAGLVLGVLATLGSLVVRRQTSAWWVLAIAIVVAVPAGVGLAALNEPFIARRGTVASAALIAGVAIWPLWLATLRTRLRLVAGACGLVVAVATLYANTAFFPGVNRPQHATLLVGTWALAVPALLALTRRSRPRTSRAVIVTWVVLALALAATGSWRAGRAGSSFRVALRELAPNASAALMLVEPVADPDGDGYSSGFGAGDCAPFDAAISPGANEVPGDGVDNNCLGGDADEGALAELRAQLRGDTTQRSGPRADRIILLTIDALRFDVSLPALNARLGHRCRVYRDAHATNSRTTFSMFSVFTSRFPTEAYLTTLGAYWVPAEDASPTFAESLTRAGFAVGAAAFNHIFDVRYGITRGFQEIWIAGVEQSVVEGVAGPRTAEMAASWLRGREAPFLLWAHFYDPHEPYLSHPGGPPPSAPDRARYDTEVAFSDHFAAQVLDSLGPNLATTAVLLTGDHGEAFGEHGSYFHNTSVYEEEIRVPLWVCPPEGMALPSAEGPVSLLDVGPTILDLAGVDVPESFRGRSLLRAHPAEPVPVFSETMRIDTPMQSVVLGRWKLVRYVEANALLLFDLETDPTEQQDRYEAEPEIAARLSALLDTWRALVDGRGATPEAPVATPNSAP